MPSAVQYDLEVAATPEEKKTGKWSKANLRKLMDEFTEYGVVILKDVIDPDQLDKLNGPMVEDAKEIRAKATRLNFGTENIQQAPILDRPEIYPKDLFQNELLFEAVRYILGPQAKFNFLSGNTAMPGGVQKRQPPHTDQLSKAKATFVLIANVPLIDVSAENGATEIWPGTHRLRDLSLFESSEYEGAAPVKPEVLEERRKQFPPIQYPVKRGSIILRDLTVWHAGMPNNSNDVRVMTALGFTAHWWASKMSFPVPSKEMDEEIRKSAESKELEVHTVVVDNYHKVKDLHNFSFDEVPSEEQK